MIIKRLATSFESLYFVGGTQTVHHSGHRFALFAGQPWCGGPFVGGPATNASSPHVVFLLLLAMCSSRFADSSKSQCTCKTCFFGIDENQVLRRWKVIICCEQMDYLFDRQNSVSSVSILTNPLSC